MLSSEPTKLVSPSVPAGSSTTERAPKTIGLIRQGGEEHQPRETGAGGELGPSDQGADADVQRRGDEFLHHLGSLLDGLIRDRDRLRHMREELVGRNDLHFHAGGLNSGGGQLA